MKDRNEDRMLVDSIVMEYETGREVILKAREEGRGMTVRIFDAENLEEIEIPEGLRGVDFILKVEER